MMLPEWMWKRLLTHEAVSQSLPGVPIAELAGDNRVLIENHEGVVEYGDQRIRIKVTFGLLCICGNALTLRSMSKHQLVVCGDIERIEILREGVRKRVR